MAIRSATSALSLAKRTRTYATRMCLKFVRTRYGVGSRYKNAAIAWAHTKRRHGGTPPKGVPVWWTGGAGHVAISAGSGYCISTDWPSRGRVGLVKISTLTRRWGKRYRGWSEDINGVRVYAKSSRAKKIKAAVTPVVGLTMLRRNALRWRSYKPQYRVKRVQRALNKAFPRSTKLAVDGIFGPKTRARYGAWQRKRGFRGRDADGIPGRVTLVALGRMYGGFRAGR